MKGRKPLPYKVLEMTGSTKTNPGLYKHRADEPSTGTKLTKPRDMKGEAMRCPSPGQGEGR